MVTRSTQPKQKSNTRGEHFSYQYVFHNWVMSLEQIQKNLIYCWHSTKAYPRKTAFVTNPTAQIAIIHTCDFKILILYINLHLFNQKLFPESQWKPKFSPEPQCHLIPFKINLMPVCHVAKLHPNNEVVWLMINSYKTSTMIWRSHNSTITLCIKWNTNSVLV